MTKVELDVKGKTLIIETGLLAKQADGSAVVRYGDTVVLATAVPSHNRLSREGLRSRQNPGRLF